METEQFDVIRFFRFAEPRPNRNFVALCPTPHNGRLPAIMQHEQNVFRRWQRDWLMPDDVHFLNAVQIVDVPESFVESVNKALWRPSRDRCGLCSLRSRQIMQDRLEKSNATLDTLEDMFTELYVSVYIEGSNADRAEAALAILPIAKRIETAKRRPPKNNGRQARRSQRELIVGGVAA